MTPYHDMPEGDSKAAAKKLNRATDNANMFGPKVRPGLWDAAAYWRAEVERLMDVLSSHMLNDAGCEFDENSGGEFNGEDGCE